MELILNTYGVSLNREGESFVITSADGRQRIPSVGITSIQISRGAQITSDAVLLAIEHEIETSSVNPAANGKSFYMQHVKEAEDFFFSNYPQDEFVFTGVKTNAKGKPRACLTNHKMHLLARIPLTPLLRKAKEGDLFACRYNAQSGYTELLTLRPTGKHIRLNTCEPASIPVANEERVVEGKVRIKPDKPFAFLNKYYISPKLRQSFGLADGQMVKAIAIQQPDGRWRVTKILSMS